MLVKRPILCANYVYISVKFYINWALNKQVMYIRSIEIMAQNQLVMSEVTHNFMYMLKASL